MISLEENRQGRIARRILDDINKLVHADGSPWKEKRLRVMYIALETIADMEVDHERDKWIRTSAKKALVAAKRTTDEAIASLAARAGDLL